MKIQEIIDLVEGVGEAVLYHGTSLPWLVRIIQNDRLTPPDYAKHASLTRSFAVASKFAVTRTLIDLDEPDQDQLIWFLPTGNSICGAVIAFDRDILSHRHKIVPYDDGFKSSSPGWSEYEERIIGPAKGIVKHYLSKPNYW